MISTAGFWDLAPSNGCCWFRALFDVLSVIYIDLAKTKSEALVNILIVYSTEKLHRVMLRTATATRTAIGLISKNTTLHMQHT